MDDASNAEDYDNDIPNEQDGGNNFGFEPLEGETDGNGEKRPSENTDTPEQRVERERLKLNIGNIISRYPSIKPRSNRDLLDSLNNLSIDDLRNVHRNAVTDVQSLRGTPGSELFISAVTFFPDSNYLPGLMDKCLNNDELLRDVDALILEYSGFYSNFQNIIFHMLNHVGEIVLGLRRKVRTKRTTNDTNEQDRQEEGSKGDSGSQAR